MYSEEQSAYHDAFKVEFFEALSAVLAENKDGIDFLSDEYRKVQPYLYAVGFPDTGHGYWVGVGMHEWDELAPEDWLSFIKVSYVFDDGDDDTVLESYYMLEATRLHVHSARGLAELAVGSIALHQRRGFAKPRFDVFGKPLGTYQVAVDVE